VICAFVTPSRGTVQKLGSHWRVSIQLFDATTLKARFPEKHDFVLDNVFEVQDEIGRPGRRITAKSFRRPAEIA
jgi:TolB-like protein